MLICSTLAAGEFSAKLPGREVNELGQNARVVLQYAEAGALFTCKMTELIPLVTMFWLHPR